MIKNPAFVRSWIRAGVFCVAYVLLDLASYIDPLHHFNITPWNPAPALGILYLLRREAGGIFAVAAAILASDLIVRDLAASVPQLLFLAVMLALGYALMSFVLRRHTPENGMFADRASLARWALIVVTGGLVNGLAFVSALVVLGLLPAANWGNAILRFWVGDGVGVFVTFPLLWWLQDTQRRLLFWTVVKRVETLGYLVIALVVLWLVFMPDGTNESRYLYALFLPVVWAASRQGIVGAVFCASLLQLGMLSAGWLLDIEDTLTFEYQIRALLLAGVGFLIGTAVDEQRRAVAELRQTLRLAAAGEMAAALAHELNQPLTALAAYGDASEIIVAREGGSVQLRDAIQRMVGEAGRAAEVVRRLRDFFRTGSTRLEQFRLDDLLGGVVGPFQEKGKAKGYDLTIGAIPNVRLYADRLQIEIVLRNLLSNATDAIMTLPAGHRHIWITAESQGGDQLCLRVKDSGPGLPPALMDGAFEPFVSTKSSGLGLGLAISRAITETHGGRLIAEPGDHGSFALYLPINPMKDPDHG